jgi:hypothetical protein
MGKRNDRSFNRINKSLERLSMADIAFDIDKDLDRGMDAEALRKKYQPRLTGRSIVIALASNDEGVATSNIKDLTDRTEGRASEKSKIPNPLEKLTTEQLEALLRTEISDLTQDSATTIN